MPERKTDTKAWQIVLNRIEADLIAGTLQPGDHLPGERQLATDLGVGRSSVREAIRVLEVLGLINTQVGSGPRAGAIIIAKPGGGMSALMRLQVAANGFEVADIVSTRTMIETGVAVELATKFLAGNGPDLQQTESLLLAMDAKDIHRDKFIILDAQLHLSLAEANGNHVVVATMAGLRSAIESYVRKGAMELDSWEDASRELRMQHRNILAAIRSGDPRLASTLVSEHITGYYTTIATREPISATGRHHG